ncbi:MAG TPA: FAD-binding protein [Candidatus Saccharimonadales bacterium]|nr:FAD-binding protein [Candidatus Saccharimonadales bacterium]
MKAFDYIVVGSGCAGAMAAQTLIEAGKKVTMLDVGEQNPGYASAVPDKDFLDLRASDIGQYKYFIGEKGEGAIIKDGGKGAQVTPPRSHMLRNVDMFVPLKSDTFTPLESLGYGGLGIGWGLQCWPFSPKELRQAGLDPKRMQSAYETIARRIGISATNDDAAEYTIGKLKTYQQSPTMDSNMVAIHKRYQAKKMTLEKAGLVLGRTPLALITEQYGERQPYQYRDMDFYDDNSKSGWRPWITVDSLRKKSNFTYINKFLAVRFEERGSQTIIHGIDTETRRAVAYACQKLILACGSLGTARVALRSTGKQGQKTSFLCNPYTYVPSLQPAFFGHAAEHRKIGFGQLSGFLAEEKTHTDTSIMTLYSYQELMLFRLLNQVPLDLVDGRMLMQYMSPGLIITGIQHSDTMSDTKTMHLRPNADSLTGDELEATYILSDTESKDQRRREDIYLRSLRKLGVYGTKRINPGHGSSVHYAGTLPFSHKEKPLSLHPSGRLHGTKNIYAADSSGFNFLPAKGLTFSLLANAHIIAENVLQDAIKD